MKLLLAFAILALGAASAQEKPALNARELFYTPPPQAATPSQAAAPAPAPVPKAVEKAKRPVRIARKTKKKAAPKEAAPAQEVAKSSPAPAPVPAPAPQAPSQFQQVALVSAVPLGLRYSILKRNSNGNYAEVDTDSTFHSGDRIRLQVEANTTAYLYVVMQGSSGNWRLLFPSAEVAGGSNRVERGESRQIPPGGRGQFVFDEQAGTEKLFLVLSRQPETDLDKLIYSIKTPQKAAPAAAPAPAPEAAGEHRVLMASVSLDDNVIERLRGQMLARDLVFEKSDSGQDGKPEKAAYVVNPSTAADARLVVDLKLKHN